MILRNYQDFESTQNIGPERKTRCLRSIGTLEVHVGLYNTTCYQTEGLGLSSIGDWHFWCDGGCVRVALLAALLHFLMYEARNVP